MQGIPPKPDISNEPYVPDLVMNFSSKSSKKTVKISKLDCCLVYSSFPAKFREERLMQEKFTQSVLSIELLISYLGGYFLKKWKELHLKVKIWTC